MNLVIDFGNTCTKQAVFSGNEIITDLISEQLSQTSLNIFLEDYPGIRNCIISSVAGYPSEILDFLRSKLELCLLLDKDTDLPIKNMYGTPGSLGYDRIAGLVGAEYLFPGKDILVIDAGSAITFDFINKKGEFTGGNISPGATMRAKALHQFTSRLPLVNPDPAFGFLGNSTETAINSGIMNGIIFETDAYIDKLKGDYPGLIVFLTGGDNYLFDKKLKNSIFVDSKLNLKGLNRILSYNASK